MKQLLAFLFLNLQIYVLVFIFLFSAPSMALGMYDCNFSDPQKALEYEALVAIYTTNPNNTLGSEWADLANGNKCLVCNLPGVTCSNGFITNLMLSNRQLKSLPVEIVHLVNLEVLSSALNQLTSVPVEIGRLVNLELLFLSGNQLTSIPTEIGQLINLKNLNLSGNQLTSIPIEIGHLVNLNNLALADNQLTSIPAELWSLVNLNSLILGDNQLTSIPPELGNLVNLRSLGLSGNQLTSIPAEIGSLFKLEFLESQRNQLTSLPAEIVNLKRLTRLFLRNNQLNCLDKSFEIFCGQRIDIIDNPIEDLITWEEFCNDPQDVCLSLDSDGDGVGDDEDLCPCVSDAIDVDADGRPDCKYPPLNQNGRVDFTQIDDAFKCGTGGENVYITFYPNKNSDDFTVYCFHTSIIPVLLSLDPERNYIGNGKECPTATRLDSDGDGVTDDMDECPCISDVIDVDADGRPDCKYPPLKGNGQVDFDQVEDRFKCSETLEYVYINYYFWPFSDQSYQYCIPSSLAAYYLGKDSRNYLGDTESCKSSFLSSSSRSTEIVAQPSPPLIVRTIAVFPNPAQEELIVDVSPYIGNTGQVIITNLYGQTVLTRDLTISTGQLTLDLDSFQNGLYFLKIKIGESELLTAKFLVQNIG